MIPDEIRRMKPLTGKERLGANRNSEYLGAEDIDPGTEPVLTIAAIYNGTVTLQRGKENKDVIVFREESVDGIRNVRPLICNATNRKTLRKLYKSVTAEELTGKRVQIYVDHKVRDPQTGDVTDGIRIRPRIPAAPRTAPIICEGCGKPITGAGRFSAEDIANMAVGKFGKKLCVECGKKAGEAQTAQEAQEPAEAENTAQNATSGATDTKEQE